MARKTKAQTAEEFTSDEDVREALASGKDHTNKEVQAALQTGKELPSGTVLSFYGRRADVARAGDATGDDGNMGGTMAGPNT